MKMIFVNLPVRNLAASTAFYLALGGELNPQFSGKHSSSIMFSDTIGVMLLTHDHYREFTKRPIGDARRDSQALFALSVDNLRRGGCDADSRGCGRRQRRSQPAAGPWLHVQPQHRGPRRLCLGDHVDGCGGARRDPVIGATNAKSKGRPDWSGRDPAAAGSPMSSSRNVGAGTLRRGDFRVCLSQTISARLTGAARSKLVAMTMADQEYAPKPSKTRESRVENVRSKFSMERE
jgi:uncharacterized protein